MGQQRRNDEPVFPKPFDFVPFGGKPDKHARPGHESFHLSNTHSGRFSYELEVKTSLHISSGSYALTDLDLGMQAKEIIRDFYKVTIRGQKQPAIPGSSLKGAARAIVEAITASCIGVTRVDKQDLPPDISRSCTPPHLCPACGLFGAMSRQARLSFSDAVFVKGDASIIRMPPLFRTHPDKGRIYRTASDKFKGRKFYFHGRPEAHSVGTFIEALKPGTLLRGSVEFTSLTAAELGLLLFALGQDESFQLALGGGKPMAMGRVVIRPRELRLRQRASFTEYEAGDGLLSGAGLDSAVSDYLRQAESLMLIPQRDKLRQILTPENPRPAPTGLY